MTKRNVKTNKYIIVQIINNEMSKLETDEFVNLFLTFEAADEKLEQIHPNYMDYTLDKLKIRFCVVSEWTQIDIDEFDEIFSGEPAAEQLSEDQDW